MKLTDLSQRASEWLRLGGPSNEVVISSRVRLARNLAGMPFLLRCSSEQQAELADRLSREVLASGVVGGGFYVDLAAAGEIDRRLLVERHLISRQHAEATCPRGVAISSDETVAIMVNEEDHVRIQVLRSGLRLTEAMGQINEVDNRLEQRLDFAFHSRLGYLTACPTNVGTGLRVSVMLHLPGLKMTGELDKAFQAARDMRLSVRGLHGEGTEATGDFFQLSNEITLGKTEEAIIEQFTQKLLPGFIEYEQRTRESLLRQHATELDDKILRAVALLRSARLLSSEEMMSLLSLVRLGVNLGRVTDIPLRVVNELFLLGQPAHLQKILAKELTGPQRAAARAEFIQQRLAAQ